MVDAVYLDFKKVDSVPHTELLIKLWRIGVIGLLWNWFKDYLNGRQHYVMIDHACSPLPPVISGVPQGGILGPLLFLIYINEPPEQIDHASCYLFADDTKLLKAIDKQSGETHMQQALDTPTSWCSVWKLSLNANKCNTMRLSAHNSQGRI